MSHPIFINRENRDTYLDKMLMNGHRVKPKRVFFHGTADRLFDASVECGTGLPYNGLAYTIEDIDKRKGN